MRQSDRPTWRQRLFEYKVFLKPFWCIVPVLVTVGVVYHLHVAKEEQYNTARPNLRPVPEISLPDANGKLHRLDELKAPGIVVFWASWCDPCVDELKRFEIDDLGAWSYLAINALEKTEDAKKFVTSAKIRKPLVLFDENSAFRDIPALPTVYVSFGNGSWAGPLKSRRFDELMKEAKHTLAKTDYQPFRDSEESLKKYRNSAFWQFYYATANLIGPVYFLLLLFQLRRQVKGTRCLSIALLAYILFSVSEMTDWRLGSLFSSRTLISEMIGHVYYSPFLWGGWIAAGIIVYLKQFLSNPIEADKNTQA